MANKGGRPQHQPSDGDRRKVEAMSAYGIRREEIASIIGIAPHTLAKHYSEELETGLARANARVAESLYKKAIGEGRDSALCAMFWLKTRAGWKEPKAEVALNATINHSGDESFAAIVAALDIAAAGKARSAGGEGEVAWSSTPAAGHA